MAKELPDGRTVEEALAQVLVEEGLNGKHRVAAVNSIFDRLEGKPKQPIDMHEKPDPSAISFEELLARNEEINRQLELEGVKMCESHNLPAHFSKLSNGLRRARRILTGNNTGGRSNSARTV